MKNFFEHSFFTNQVILRPVHSQDARQIFVLAHKSDLYKHTYIPKNYSYLTAKKWVEQQLKKPRTLLIENRETGAIMGTIGVVDGDEAKRQCEIAYWVGSRYRRLGYMRVALGLFLRNLASHTMIRKVSARVFIQNKRSLRLLESRGFIKEGVLKNHLYHNGKMKSVVIMGYIIK